jgi:hypothetical protein
VTYPSLYRAKAVASRPVWSPPSCRRFGENDHDPDALGSLPELTMAGPFQAATASSRCGLSGFER